jgi:hypothetical protein
MDTNPTLCVCCYMMIAWVQDPLYPSFYSPSEVGFTCKIESVQLYETQTISLLAYLQDLVMYLSSATPESGMGHLT